MRSATSSPVALSRLPVGSSAISSFGLARERARDRDALLLAAGELLRIVRRALGEPDAREPIAAPSPRHRAAPASSSGSITFSSAVSCGNSWNDWNTKPSRRWRSAARASSSSPESAWPSSQHLALASVGRGPPEGPAASSCPSPMRRRWQPHRPDRSRSQTSSRIVSGASPLVTILVSRSARRRGWVIAGRRFGRGGPLTARWRRARRRRGAKERRPPPSVRIAGFYRAARGAVGKALQSQLDSTMASSHLVVFPPPHRRPSRRAGARASPWRHAQGRCAGVDAARRRRFDLRGVRTPAGGRLGRPSAARLTAQKLPYRVVNASISGDTTAGGTRAPAGAARHATSPQSWSSSSAATTACAAAVSRRRATISTAMVAAIAGRRREARDRRNEAAAQLRPGVRRASSMRCSPSVAQARKVPLVPFFFEGFGERNDCSSPTASTRPRRRSRSSSTMSGRASLPLLESRR